MLTRTEPPGQGPIAYFKYNVTSVSSSPPHGRSRREELIGTMSPTPRTVPGTPHPSVHAERERWRQSVTSGVHCPDQSHHRPALSKRLFSGRPRVDSAGPHCGSSLWLLRGDLQHGCWMRSAWWFLGPAQAQASARALPSLCVPSLALATFVHLWHLAQVSPPRVMAESCQCPQHSVGRLQRAGSQADLLTG